MGSALLCREPLGLLRLRALRVDHFGQPGGQLAQLCGAERIDVLEDGCLTGGDVFPGEAGRQLAEASHDRFCLRKRDGALVEGCADEGEPVCEICCEPQAGRGLGGGGAHRLAHVFENGICGHQLGLLQEVQLEPGKLGLDFLHRSDQARQLLRGGLRASRERAQCIPERRDVALPQILCLVHTFYYCRALRQKCGRSPPTSEHYSLCGN